MTSRYITRQKHLANNLFTIKNVLSFRTCEHLLGLTLATGCLLY